LMFWLCSSSACSNEVLSMMLGLSLCALPCFYTRDRKS
jgi:hypothetical protein